MWHKMLFLGLNTLNLIQSIMILCLAEGIYQPRALTLRQNAFLWPFAQCRPGIQPTEVHRWDFMYCVLDLRFVTD